MPTGRGGTRVARLRSRRRRRGGRRLRGHRARRPASARSEHPLGGREAARLIAARAWAPPSRAARRCSAAARASWGATAMGPACWASDAAAGDGQWVQFELSRGPRPSTTGTSGATTPTTRAPPAARSPRSMCSLYLDATAPSGWRSVGRCQVPPPTLSDTDRGVSVRLSGVPAYLVPAAYRGATLRSVPWLGFQTSSLRLAALASHGADDYGASFGLCEVAESSYSPNARCSSPAPPPRARGCFRLTPGAAFVGAAARAEPYLPQSWGDHELDESARRMRRWLCVRGPPPRRRRARGHRRRRRSPRASLGLTARIVPTLRRWTRMGMAT